MAIISAKWALTEEYEIEIPVTSTYTGMKIVSFACKLAFPSSNEPSVVLVATNISNCHTSFFSKNGATGASRVSILSSATPTVAGYYVSRLPSVTGLQFNTPTRKLSVSVRTASGDIISANLESASLLLELY
jgi:hypothetical protein